jgi:hypothetical protein
LLSSKKWSSPITSRLAYQNGQVAFVDKLNRLTIYHLSDKKIDQKLVLSNPCVWGPYTVNEAFLLTTSDGKLFRLGTNGTLVDTESPIPVGEPLSVGGEVVLNSSGGKLWKYNSATNKTVFSAETKVPASIGVQQSENGFLLFGKNGIIYAAPSELRTK